MSRFNPTSILYTVQAGTAYALRVLEDGSDWVLSSLSKVAQKESDSSFQYLKMLDYGGIKTSLFSKDGLEYAFPITSSDPSLIVNGFVEQDGAVPDKQDLRVDGSSAAVDFHFHADPSKDLRIIGYTFVIVANSLSFGSGNFAGLSTLTNGVEVSLTVGTSTGILANLVRNECFLHAASIGGFTLLIANKDVISSSVEFGGAITLEAGSADKLTVKVQDDIDAGIDYFKCSVKAIKEP